MGTAQATPVVEFDKTTKGGIDLESFDKVELFKKYQVPAPVTSVADALSRLGNDQSKFLKILDSGLKSEAGKAAREAEDGWLTYDENGKETDTLYKGTLVSNEILNPLVLNFAKILPTDVTRDGKTVSITWDEATSAEEKQAIKANAVAAIRSQPSTVAALKRKMAAPAA